MTGRSAEPAPSPCLFPEPRWRCSWRSRFGFGLVLCCHPLVRVGREGNRTLVIRRTCSPAHPGKPAGDTRPAPAHPAKVHGASIWRLAVRSRPECPGAVSPAPAAHTRGPDIRPAQAQGSTVGSVPAATAGCSGLVARSGRQCRQDGQRRSEVGPEAWAAIVWSSSFSAAVDLSEQCGRRTSAAERDWPAMTRLDHFHPRSA